MGCAVGLVGSSGMVGLCFLVLLFRVLLLLLLLLSGTYLISDWRK